jgi:hypothetical protein
MEQRLILSQTLMNKNLSKKLAFSVKANYVAVKLGLLLLVCQFSLETTDVISFKVHKCKGRTLLVVYV